MRAVQFAWNGQVVYAAYVEPVPPVGAFVDLEGRHYRVHSLLYTVEPAPSCLSQPIEGYYTVNLRRLHHAAEWGNQDEPSGYAYCDIQEVT